MSNGHGNQYGENNPFWKGGITPLYSAIRNLAEYKKWRLEIFVRDSFGCVFCGDTKGGNLNAHHIGKSFAELLMGFLKEYNQFSPLEDQHTLLRLAMKWQPFWNAEGKTLCKDCHIKEHKRIVNLYKKEEVIT